MQDFDYILKGFCKNCVGDHLIKRGAYQILSAQDSSMVNRSDFARLAEPGKVFEMSMILRKRITDLGSQKACPRCRYSNEGTIAYGGWIEWCG